MQTLIFSDVLQPGYGKNAGAYRVATELRDNGFTCQVIDFFTHFSVEEIFAIIDRFVDTDTIWVGISTTFFFPFERDSDIKQIKLLGLGDVDPITNFHSAFPFSADIMKEIFKYIRSKNPKTKILVGGGRTWEAQQYDALINKVYADYYVHGFADESAVVLTKWLHDKSNPKPVFQGWFNNLIDSNKDYDYHNFNTSKIKYIANDIIDRDEYIPIEIARGCVFKCKFCNFPLLGKKRGDYTKTKETLIEEFIRNYELFGTTNYMLMDETINDSMEKVEFVHDVITSLPFKIKWGSFARIDLYYNNPDMARMLQETGMAHTQFGIETFNKKSGGAIGKGMHPDKVKELLLNLKSQWKSDVRITSGFVLGLPHETKETIADLEKYLLSDKCGLDAWNLYPLMLMEGQPSVFGQDTKKYGYSHPTKDPLEWHNEHMTFTEAKDMAHQIRTSTMHLCKVYNWNHIRVQNLGYTETEVDAMTLESYTKNMSEIWARLKIKKDNYFKALMQ